MNKLHITRKQWIFFLRWAVYGAMLLLAMALQGTILSRLSIFGVKLNLLPACIICVALQEGQVAFLPCAPVRFWRWRARTLVISVSRC